MLQRLKDKINVKDLPATPRKQDLEAADILQGFKLVSKHLRAQNSKRVGSPIIIVVSGGACSVLVLRNRTRTRNVDFFAHSADDMRELLLAKRLASPDLRGFPNQWLSADIVSSIIDNAADESLYADSVAQGTVMYQSDVLRVYAADWRFQLVAKIARAHERGQLANDEHFGNDMSDTVAILRLLVEQNKGRPIRIADVRGWYALGRRLTDEELEHAEAAYEAVHGEHALAGESEVGGEEDSGLME